MQNEAVTRVFLSVGSRDLQSVSSTAYLSSSPEHDEFSLVVSVITDTRKETYLHLRRK